MNTKHLCTVGIIAGLLAAAGCGGSTKGAGNADAGQGGAIEDGGVGGAGGTGAGGLGTGGRGTGGIGAGGIGAGGRGTGGGGAGGRGTGGIDAGGIGGIDASGTGGIDAGGGIGGIDAGGLGTGGRGTGGIGGGGVDGGIIPGTPTAPAVPRGGTYMGFPERFNRYYTDGTWQPGTTVYVSPDGTGNGSSRTTPASVASAMSNAVPGRRIVFTTGIYSGCYEFDDSHNGTYESPIVLFGERKSDGSLGVTINCCSTGRKTCFNLEAANYVAIDGFELVGEDYGVRAVGAGYASNEHQMGTAVLNSTGHGQNKDPFFTGQSDWYVIEHCTGYDSGSGDGHGIYLSNGSDWNIARYNETYNTVSSDFQINADPASTCADDGVEYDDPECDAVAGSSTTGGRGASDFMLIEGNFFHHSLAQGPNFTSVRNSVIRNNIFALPARHGTSFWQETDNPKLGSSNNLIAHNLFVTSVSNRQAIGITNSSTNNQIKNNVVVAVTISGSTVGPNTGGQLLATDSSTVNANTFEHNAWISGFFGSEDSSDPYAPNATELRQTTFVASWFAAFPTAVGHDPSAFAPATTAPWLDLGSLLPEVPTDRDGTARHAPVDLGPYER